MRVAGARVMGVRGEARWGNLNMGAEYIWDGEPKRRESGEAGEWLASSVSRRVCSKHVSVLLTIICPLQTLCMVPCGSPGLIGREGVRERPWHASLDLIEPHSPPGDPTEYGQKS